MVTVSLHAGNPGPMTGSGNHTYLLVADRRAVLIDAGVGRSEHLDALAKALSEQQAVLVDVVVTHGHSDHIGGAQAVATRYPEARFFKHPATSGPALGRPWQPLADRQRVTFGDEAIVCLWTPGHAPDHCAFWHESTRTLFAGDLVLPGGTVTIPFSRGGDVAAYLASIERLIALAPDLLLPAHGNPVRQPLPALRAHLAHRLARERQVLERLSAGQSTVEVISESIYHGLPLALQPAARENVRAHLEKLKHDARAVEHDGRWWPVAPSQESSPT